MTPEGAANVVTFPGNTTDNTSNHLWQERNALTCMADLRQYLGGAVPQDALTEIEGGLAKAGMSIRLTPYVMSLIDWTKLETDPIRRQFLPMRGEIEDDHPCLTLDALEESDHSPAKGLVHRYPDKALFLATTACPVYCQFCTRSYAVGLNTEAVRKIDIASRQQWQAALDYIRATPAIEDVVVSGGDVARLKAVHLNMLGNALLDIGHVRRIRFASKTLSVMPMKILNDDEWTNAIVNLAERARKQFKDVCLHTHINHPREITPLLHAAMAKLHSTGLVVRNQSVLLRGVNDNAKTLIDLIRALGRVNIHPYYVYLCDMVKAIEHFRVPLHQARELEKQVRGATAGFNTPLFIVDTPGGKRDAHSAEFYDREYGISGFIAPIVSPGRLFYYFDPLRSLSARAREVWRQPHAMENIVAQSLPRIAANEG